MTLTASGITSRPMPSPGIMAMRFFWLTAGKGTTKFARKSRNGPKKPKAGQQPDRGKRSHPPCLHRCVCFAIIEGGTMTATALHDKLASASAHLGEYSGTATAADFGDVRAEFNALLAGSGVYDLGWRAKIAVTGRDGMRWLNRMVTSSVRDLAVSHGLYAFLLNPQGHILADLYAYNRGDSLLADTDHSQLEKVLSIFDK